MEPHEFAETEKAFEDSDYSDSDIDVVNISADINNSEVSSNIDLTYPVDGLQKDASIQQNGNNRSSTSSTYSIFSESIDEDFAKNHNIAERIRRKELAALFSNLHKQLLLEGFGVHRSLTKIRILQTSIDIIQKKKEREKELMKENNKWLRLVEIKEAILKEMRLQVVFGSSEKKMD